MKRSALRLWLMHAAGLTALCSACGGCWQIRSAHTSSRDYSLGEAPIDPANERGDSAFDDCVNGGRVFQMYCGSCHNARALGERPFASYEVAAAHMREQAYLTGKEYRSLIHFMRRWHDVGAPTTTVEPSPKRFFFSQPIQELRDQVPERSAGPSLQPINEP